MPSQLEVINMALLKVPLPIAASLNDANWNAVENFEQVTKEVLRSYPWGFATKFEVLRRSGTPPFGFTYAYDLPDDYVRVVDVRIVQDLRGPKARYVVSSDGRLFTNANPCNCRYVYTALDPEDDYWTPDFTEAVACLLAARIASLAAQDSSLYAKLIIFYNDALLRAQQADATETTERVPYDESILTARGRGRETPA